VDVWRWSRNRIVPLAGVFLVALLTLLIYGQTLSVAAVE